MGLSDAMGIYAFNKNVLAGHSMAIARLFVAVQVMLSYERNHITVMSVPSLSLFLIGCGVVFYSFRLPMCSCSLWPGMISPTRTSIVGH